MDKPNIAARAPAQVELKAGETYWWCRCGLSKNQPFCDGSHAGTAFEPMEYKATRDRSLWLCACKQTRKAPFCDGAHNDL